jgi:hypothetical protein
MSRLDEIRDRVDRGWYWPDDVPYLLEIAEAAEDVMADFDYVNGWGYEAGGKSLDDNLDRLRQALQDEPLTEEE